MFTLRLREASTIPIDMTGILPETLEGLTLLEAAKRTVRYGNRVVEIGELFEVGPERECKSEIMRGLWIEGDCANLHNVGRGMTRLRINVHGAVGRHAGARMSGGCVSISGNAGDWLGAEMSGGRIAVSGNAGSQVGAAYRGNRLGMSGGRIFILKNVGDEAGLRMRRGFIRINGNCGTFAGAAMIAGTITIRGTVGEHLAAGMKRGTILTTQQPMLSPGFCFACEYQPQYMHFLNEEFRGGGEVLPQQDIRSVRLYRGDILTGGRGELWHVVS